MKDNIQKLIYSLVIIIVVCALTFFVNKDLYRQIIVEDGVVEYGTAFLLLISSILFIVKVVKLKADRSLLWVIFNLFLALGLFFGFGEEISWGQRIFSVEAGEFFKENNLQGETNLHNLKINGVKINKWIFSYAISLVFGVYFLILPFIYPKQLKIKKLIDLLGVPVPRVKQSILFLVASLIIFIVPDSKKWELWECLFGLVFLLIILNPFNSEENFIE